MRGPFLYDQHSPRRLGVYSLALHCLIRCPMPRELLFIFTFNRVEVTVFRG
jgi:hypothetical protein